MRHLDTVCPSLSLISSPSLLSVLPLSLLVCLLSNLCLSACSCPAPLIPPSFNVCLSSSHCILSPSPPSPIYLLLFCHCLHSRLSLSSRVFPFISSFCPLLWTAPFSVFFCPSSSPIFSALSPHGRVSLHCPFPLCLLLPPCLLHPLIFPVSNFPLIPLMSCLHCPMSASLLPFLYLSCLCPSLSLSTVPSLPSCVPFL